MYRVGYIDDEPVQYDNYRKKLERRYKDMKLILLDECATKEEFVEKIYEEQVDVLLIDYKMAGSYGFNGTTLISYINDHICDLECFILTAVDQKTISDGLVATRNRFTKTIFDTEGDDPGKVEEFDKFISILRESADVFRTRREQKIERYEELLEKKKQNRLRNDEDEYLGLYKVLSSYGMVEKLPRAMLESEFENSLDTLLLIGKKILDDHRTE